MVRGIVEVNKDEVVGQFLRLGDSILDFISNHEGKIIAPIFEGRSEREIEFPEEEASSDGRYDAEKSPDSVLIQLVT